MNAPAEVAYRIDAADNITTVNEAWCDFARANDGGQLLPPRILGNSLWPWITDLTTNQLYHSLLDRVRKNLGPVRFRFRCDAPDQRRLLQMQIMATGEDAVDFSTTLILSRPRAAVPLMNPGLPHSKAVINICGWCMRILVGSRDWLEVEQAVPALRLFEGSALPRLSHGICPRCLVTMESALDDPGLAASGDLVVGDPE